MADEKGRRLRIVKGAFEVIAAMAQASGAAGAVAIELEKHGFRVLGVAIGAPGAMQLAGLLALGDPPRPKSAACVAELAQWAFTP